MCDVSPGVVELILLIIERYRGVNLYLHSQWVAHKQVVANCTGLSSDLVPCMQRTEDMLP